MVNNRPVAGFTHPGYYSRIIPPSTLTIVSPSLDISTAGRHVGTPSDGMTNAFLIGGAIVLGLAIAALALTYKRTTR